MQEHELRGELAARTAFQAAVSSWPNSRRRLRRTPAAIAVTTVATMLVATTSLAAASVLPGPANRAVDGILGSVGVDIGPPATPPTAPGTGGSAAVAPTPTALGRAGVTHVGCSAGNAGSGSASGSIQTASCTINAPHRQPGSSGGTGGRRTPRYEVHFVHPRCPELSTTGPRTPPPATPVPALHRRFVGRTGPEHAADRRCRAGAPPGAGTSVGAPARDHRRDRHHHDDRPTTTTTDDRSRPPPRPRTRRPRAPGAGHHGGHHGTGGGTGTTTTTTTTPERPRRSRSPDGAAGRWWTRRVLSMPP